MKPKILIIGPTPPPYMGPSMATKMIIESELNDRFQIIHLDTSDKRDLKNLGRFDFRNVYLAVFHIFRLLWLLVRYSPQIVYIPISQSTLGFLRDAFFIFISKSGGSKVIVHLRGGYFREFYKETNMLTKFLIRFALKCVSRAIVLGESLRYIFKGFIPDKNILVVPNGLPTDYFSNSINKANQINSSREMRSIFHWDSMNLRVLFLSNLIESKGFIDVIKAIPKIIKNFQNVEFIFAGEWWISQSVKEEIYQFINKNNLTQIVKFPGVVIGEQKRNFLLSSNLFVLPTYYPYEGQPWVIVEAMAAGLPIITTDTDTIKEMVIDGENGFIVEKKNPEQIAEKIILLLENEKMRKRMGKKSHERFLKYYTRENFIGGLKRVFTDALHNSHKILPPSK